MPASYALLQPGDPAPWFHQSSTSNQRCAFDSVGGGYAVPCFLGSAADAHAQAALAAVAAARRQFDDVRAGFFGVTIDPADRSEAPGIGRGRRYAFLPFVHDETAARVRENAKFIDGDTSGYRANEAAAP